jgi:hypothetical protein
VDAVACLVKPPVTPLEAEALETFRGQGCGSSKAT